MREYANRKGNIYPIHGFEIICQMMAIKRGDKLGHLVSVENEDFIMGKKARELAAEDDLYKEFANKDFRGTFNTLVHLKNPRPLLKPPPLVVDSPILPNFLLIKTSRGRTIVVQHDASTHYLN